jgi:transcriptional regulator NrdR family protein
MDKKMGCVVYSCPRCGSTNVSVVDSRPKENHIWRRRKCLECGEKYTTYEVDAKLFEKIKAKAEAIDTLKSALKVLEKG